MDVGVFVGGGVVNEEGEGYAGDGEDGEADEGEAAVDDSDEGAGFGGYGGRGIGRSYSDGGLKSVGGKVGSS